MYYGSFTVKTLPGKRFAGIEHLKKLAALIEEKHGLKAQVLGNVAGAIYKNHLVVSYENMTEVEEFSKKLNADDDFQAWFTESLELIEWVDARQDIFVVF